LPIRHEAISTGSDEDHPARYALQAIPAPEATEALVTALPKAPPDIKIGIASSLGDRARSGKKVASGQLVSLLTDKDPALARAGALALGAIGSPEAARALSSARESDANTRTAIADGLLECAENLLAAGNKAEAKAAYEKILASQPSEAVRTAATRGVAASS
jgi:HEAT repeat protein